MVILRNPGFPFAFGGWVGLALVVCGVLMARFLELAACPLCIWQRILYMLFAVLALIGYSCVAKPFVRRLVALLMACTAGAGACVAGYQVWIQRFSPVTTCVGKEPWWETFITWAGNQVPLLFKASGLCSDPAWKFLDLSIADWSLMFFSALLVLSLYAATRSYN